MRGSSLTDEEEVVHNYMVSKPCGGHYIPFHFIRSLEKISIQNSIIYLPKCNAFKLFHIYNSNHSLGDKLVKVERITNAEEFLSHYLLEIVGK